MIDNILTSLVKIIDKSNNTIKGAGFFIGNKGYIITCHHVIFELDEIWIEYDTQQFLATWSEIFSNIELDIAILKIDIINPPSFPLLNTSNIYNANIILCGFPNIKTNNFPNGYAIQDIMLSASTPLRTLSTFTKKNINLKNHWNILPKEESTFSSFQINKKQPHGMSGGFVYSIKHNAIIGIIQSTSSTEDLSYAIRISNLFDYLDELDFERLGVSMNKMNNQVDIVDDLILFKVGDLRRIAHKLNYPVYKIQDNPNPETLALDICDWVESRGKINVLQKLVNKFK